MEIQEEDVRTLTSLELTSRQARVYLAMVLTGRTTIKRLSKAAKVSRQDTYAIVSKLQRLGLVEKALTVPTTFKAVPLEEGLSILFQRQKKALNRTQSKLEKLFRRFRENSWEEIPQEEEPQFSVISGREHIEAVSSKDLLAALATIDLCSNWEMFTHFIFVFADLIQEAKKKGLRSRVVINKPENDEAFLKITHFVSKNSSWELRFARYDVPLPLLILDGKVASLLTVESAKYPANNLSVIRSGNAVFVQLINHYFKSIWNEAIECMPEGYSCV